MLFGQVSLLEDMVHGDLCRMICIILEGGSGPQWPTLMPAILSLKRQSLESRRLVFFLTFLLKMAVFLGGGPPVSDYQPTSKKMFPWPEAVFSRVSREADGCAWEGWKKRSQKMGAGAEMGNDTLGSNQSLRQSLPLVSFLLFTPGTATFPSLLPGTFHLRLSPSESANNLAADFSFTSCSYSTGGEKLIGVF